MTFELIVNTISNAIFRKSLIQNIKLNFVKTVYPSKIFIFPKNKTDWFKWSVKNGQPERNF